ncbi:MAG: GNAT family N-acetyltransferase [Gemmatimonadaceae bacterium]
MTEHLVVEHQASQYRFSLVVPEGTAVLDYRLRGPNVMEMFHTFTPHSARGRGVASTLVRGALDYVRGNNFRIIPACWYVANFMEKHEEYRDLLADDGGIERPAPACEI